MVKRELLLLSQHEHCCESMIRAKRKQITMNGITQNSGKFVLNN